MCEVHDLGRMHWSSADQLQRELVEKRKLEQIPDQLLLVEHPHVITLGRNARSANVLASPDLLDRAGIELFETNRGGDVTYHGPGQIVGYPILDLNGWKRDVHEYVRAIEEVIIQAIAGFGIRGERSSINSGVWVNGAKICAIGIHISRWITSHGFALNVNTNLDYFRYIVPCGLTQPVTSFAAQGIHCNSAEVREAIISCFGQVFGYQMCAFTEERIS